MNATNLTEIFLAATAARTPEDLFGPPLATPAETFQVVRQKYRAFVQIAHPDHCPNDLLMAERTMHLLNRWRAFAEEKIQAATYGKPPAVAAPLALRTGTYSLHELLRRGDYFSLYRCTATADFATTLLLKVVDNPADNDLLQQEAATFRALESAPPQARSYFPRLVECFLWSDAHTRRQALLYRARIDTLALSKIRIAFPAGLDPRDAAWMFNRLLEMLWFTHNRGLVHGAILPANLRVGLSDHGLVAEGWSCSVEIGTPLRAINGTYKNWYPPEVLQKQPATPATDIFMAARCLIYLLGGDPISASLPASVPPRLARFIHGSLLSAPARRPQDVGTLREEFEDHLAELYGRRTFRPLAIPA